MESSFVNRTDQNLGYRNRKENEKQKNRSSVQKPRRQSDGFGIDLHVWWEGFVEKVASFEYGVKMGRLNEWWHRCNKVERDNVTAYIGRQVWRRFCRLFIGSITHFMNDLRDHTVKSGQSIFTFRCPTSFSSVNVDEIFPVRHVIRRRSPSDPWFELDFRTAKRLTQSWTWVQFSWPDPTRPTTDVTQPDPTQN